MRDSLARSLAKTILWRVIATLITLIIVYAVTGEFKQATTITLTIAAILAVGYYLHERVWDKINWGRHVHSFIQSE